GVGSVGTFCAVGLFMSGDGAPLFLQIKEAGKSVLECLGPKFKAHPGRRVVEGQRVMQTASDVFLDWTQDQASGTHCSVRQLKNRHLGTISELVEQRALGNYARLCGRTLARAHARSADPVVLAGYMGKSAVMDDALASFAMAYAQRTQRDYDRLVAARGPGGKGRGGLKGTAAAAGTYGATRDLSLAPSRPCSVHIGITLSSSCPRLARASTSYWLEMKTWMAGHKRVHARLPTRYARPSPILI